MSESRKFHFQNIDNAEVLLPVVKERLPNSCHIFNQILLQQNFPEDLKFYAVVEKDNEINSDTWILVFHIREDYGNTVYVSAPTNISTGKVPVSAEIKECFSDGGVIDWNQNTFYGVLEKPVSAMIFDISANINGNITEVHPCILYNMENSDALKLEIGNPRDNAELHRLDAEKDYDFILSTWKYSLPGSEKVIKKSIAKNASAGVFLDGKCVSGVIVPANGIVGFLYTLKDFRGKGYAKLVMQYTFKEFAKDGCIPCLTVEVKNERSIQFHKSLGVKAVSYVDGILVQNLDID